MIDLNDASFLSAAKEKEYGLAYTQSVSSIPLNQGVYLYGNPGTGKSYLMKGICNYYAKSNKSVSFVQVPLLIQELKQFMTDNEYRQRVMNHCVIVMFWFWMILELKVLRNGRAMKFYFRF